MDDNAGKDKPNLKICIDNTESDSETEASLSSSDASDEDSDESEREVKNDQVEFNVRIGKTQPPVAKKTTTTSLSTKKSSDSTSEPFQKRYENKAGEFISGLDLTDKKLQEKREERAKRFGIPAKAQKLDYVELNESLGIKPEKPEHDERGVRPEAIHMRGLDDMHTQDVFKYFQEYGPGSIEWIDDTSCNVVWMDQANAARALMKLSRSQTCIEKYLKKKQRKTEPHRLQTARVEDGKDIPESSNSESEDDELDLTEDPVNKAMNDTESAMDTTEAQPMKESEKEIKKEKEEKAPESSESEQKEEDMEEGELPSDAGSSDGESGDSMDEIFKGVNLSRVIWPPGKWRLGVPCRKAKYLFFRYATKADVKLPGAEGRSKYYIRHGNPNYGGMKGLISKSRKRQHWSRRQQQEDERAAVDGRKFDVKIPRGRELPDYSDVAMFTGDVNIEEREDFDRNPAAKPAPTTYGSEGEDWEEELSGEEVADSPPPVTAQPALYTKGFSLLHHDRLSPFVDDNSRSPGGSATGREDDSSAAELELEKLLAVPRRSGRMYADDVEEEIKAKISKRSDDPNDLTVITDVRDRLEERKPRNHSPAHNVNDARQLITGKGLDLRSRLERRRHKVPRRHKNTDEDSDSAKYHSLRIKVMD